MNQSKEDPKEQQRRKALAAAAVSNSMRSNFMDLERLLNTEEVDNARLFAFSPDPVVKEVLKSALSYKDLSKIEAGRAEVWCQREMARLKAKGIAGMERFSALNLLNVLIGLNPCKSREYIADALVKHGFVQGPMKKPVVSVFGGVSYQIQIFVLTFLVFKL